VTLSIDKKVKNLNIYESLLFNKFESAFGSRGAIGPGTGLNLSGIIFKIQNFSILGAIHSCLR